MPTDKRVDAYIRKSPEFARPILLHLRELVHEVVPDIEETIKWGFPHFVKKGNVMSMASFKAHCAVVFPKATLLKNNKKILEIKSRSAMGHFGRIGSLSDLPQDKEIKSLILQAVDVNALGIKREPGLKKSRKKIVVPKDFSQVLNRKKVMELFESLSYSQRKEYVEWIEDAKKTETRNRRIIRAISNITEGMGRNDKYKK